MIPYFTIDFKSYFYFFRDFDQISAYMTGFHMTGQGGVPCTPCRFVPYNGKG